MTYLLVGFGGAIGAMSRFWIGRQIGSRTSGAFPTGTTIINISGSLLIGLLLGWMLKQSDAGGNWRPLLVIGVLGGYTTFSTFAFEAAELIENGFYARAASYVLASNLVALVACGIGLWIGRLVAA